MRIGIFFGGPSREREISFAGGRTVYDNLDKNLFEPIPVFIDSLGHLILLDWSYLYKGTIRDFYPPVQFLPNSPNAFQVYIESLNITDRQTLDQLMQEVGQPISWEELDQHIDFAFLALHGQLGEDGQIQGILEVLGIPYSGSGLRASCIGMDKAYQKRLMEKAGFDMPAMRIIKRRAWMQRQDQQWAEGVEQEIGFPIVIRPANQGSSIGVRIVNTIKEVEKAIDAAFFIEEITATTWTAYSHEEKVNFLKELTDIRTGIGFPLRKVGEQSLIHHPEELLVYLDSYLTEANSVQLESLNSEHTVVLESFIAGKEFSCVVIKGEEGESIALPPTEILKGSEVFDYRSKYLAGLSRKLTPIDLPQEQIQAIRKECALLFEYFGFNTYARIDGFIQEDGRIFLNDPNTTSGMLPSSFFFHQAAEIGLNPSQFLTYIIRQSLIERLENSTSLGISAEQSLQKMDARMQAQSNQLEEKERVAVLLGGYSSERHISLESGRNIYEKLASSTKYLPIPVFVYGDADSHSLTQIPIHLLLKDNADDIRDKILAYDRHPILQQIQEECSAITARYVGEQALFKPKTLTYTDLKEQIDAVFIALHGRPGEDGAVQKELEALQIPFNGSLSHSAAITINKYDTLQRLKKGGFTVAEQVLVVKEAYAESAEKVMEDIEAKLDYPLIAKPIDDGCSSAVKKIKNREQMHAFLKALFREEELVDAENTIILGLKPKEEFPQKKLALLEELIEQGEAIHFLEITGGLLTSYQEETGTLAYEVFEPSEALATGEVLSLEEKFLAGEGQNITPARFVPHSREFTHESLSIQVRQRLEEAAKILGVSGYARIDAFVRIYEDGRAETIVIEVNSLPGMTPATCIFHQAAINTYKPYEFIDAILTFGKLRNQKTFTV